MIFTNIYNFHLGVTLGVTHPPAESHVGNGGNVLVDY